FRKGDNVHKKDQVTNFVMEALAQLPLLEKLNLSGRKKITPNGFKHLVALKNIRNLNLSYTNLDDKALGYIVQLPLLQILDLDSCNKITANGFQQLQLLKNIRELYLKETAVDDKALQSLRGYVHL